MREILLSKRASDKLEKLLEYLELEWSLKVKKAFIGKLDTAFAQISKYPDSAPKSDSVKGLHRFVISKQTTMYYKYDSKSIKIVTFFDTRMNPKRLKKDTK
ncbi:type II toxin-antitoxin system RelE/ParE family toxin [Marivirga harenae]|uniref:type II toxin-antitoxin system RelE/ParE family toxin n=1 Tax=Marivirga harenae TaxID=2010992 RepID=UPI0026E0E114|nr:type II toxin-antitoxin system RelE/ParE family toxin [Marivirga harenae]WKV11822.1 type II toxin-antitoxin system RelE/ParE family toxin [Marivirga harenae]